MQADQTWMIGTYGVITSMIVKAHPRQNLTIASLVFNFNPPTATNPPTPGPTVTTNNATAFWAGLNAVYRFGLPVSDAGGYLWTNAGPQGQQTGPNASYQMDARIQMPGLTPAQVTTLIAPLISDLNALGIPVRPNPPTTAPFSQPGSSGNGGGVGNSNFGSRLFPRAQFEDDVAFERVMSAVKSIIVEGRYLFHGLNMAPTLAAAGFPPPSGVSPVWRKSIMHADVFDFGTDLARLTPAEALAAHDRLDSYMAVLRAATPGGGAYMNEADALEPEWQRSFFGGEEDGGKNYARLLEIKRARDPWGVFWAHHTVGSEGWRVLSGGGGGLDNTLWPTQVGRLCRV